jgi:hypothetical protein
MEIALCIGVATVGVVALMVCAAMALWPIKSTPLPPLPSTGDPWKDAAQEWDRAAKLWREVG